MAPVNLGDGALLDDLAAFTRADRHDLAVRLLTISALRAQGEITDEEFAERRAGLDRR